MSTEVTRLRTALEAILAREPEWPAVPQALSQEIEHLRRMLGGGGGGGDQPPRDRMREAVRAFRQTGRLSNLGHARLVCFGCVDRFAATEPPLIEEQQLFRVLLRETDRFAAEPRAIRRCYRGLLHCYFKYAQDMISTPAVGRQNWCELRTYLHARIGNIRTQDYSPDWVMAIEEHRNLLTPEPVARYGLAFLRGEPGEFRLACTNLEIDADSWVRRELVLAQVRAAIGQNDESFRSLLGKLLDLLNDHPLQRDEALSLILDRYAEQRECPENPRLRDAAVGAWGSPWMTRNDAAWRRVTPQARAMVHAWLNLKLIQQFFEVLSEDRHTDQRRVRYWKKFHQQIEEIYFALGPAAMYSRSADIQKLRRDMGPHLLGLRGGGAENNAFVMRVGGLLVVEFGLSGNACYVFDASHPPFSLQGELSSDRTGLKHPSNRARMLHVDRALEPWEDQFSETLRTLGVTLREAFESYPPSRGYEIRDAERTPRVEPSLPQEEWSWTAFRRWADTYGFEISDLTRRGGSLWVTGPGADDKHSMLLKGWRFRWSDRRNAWYRAE